MSTEVIQQRKKTKKTFDEIVEEIRIVLSKTKAVYIEMMCLALREENPNWDNKDIQIKVENTCQEFGWNQDTVYQYLPSWIHDQVKVRREKAKWEKRHEAERKKAEKNLFHIASDKIQEPRISSDYDEDEPDEQVGGPMLQSYGDNAESAITLYAKINVPMRDLFHALTKKQLPVSDSIDLILDYLKPSREYRKGIFYEVEQDMRVSLYNAMVYTRDALDDTIRILDTIDKAEGRLNE